MTEVTIRQVEEADFKFMHDTLYKTWYNDENEQTKIARGFAEMDLNHTLNQSTYGLVAEADGQKLGFILAKVDKEPPHLRQLQSDPYPSLTAILTASKDTQAEYFSGFLREQEINDEMLKQSKTKFDAEICLFIVTPEARGLGVGSRLYQKVIDYFTTHDVNNYFLFTDDACNFTFYENRQMERTQTKPYYKDSKLEESTFNYYLYENSN